MFGRKSVDSILNGFSKMVNDLQVIIEEEVGWQVKREEEIKNMMNANVKSAVEIGRAQNAINQLNKLLNPVPMSKRLN